MDLFDNENRIDLCFESNYENTYRLFVIHSIIYFIRFLIDNG